MAGDCLEPGWIGLYIPSDIKISLGPRDVPRALPSGHLLVLGKYFGRQGCTTHYILPLGVYNKALLYTYTVERRDVLGYTSSTTKRFPEGRGKSWGWRSGCKIPALRKSLGPRGMYFPIYPSSRQCTDTIPVWLKFAQQKTYNGTRVVNKIQQIIN